MELIKPIKIEPFHLSKSLRYEFLILISTFVRNKYKVSIIMCIYDENTSFLVVNGDIKNGVVIDGKSKTNN
jgi:hypothetical protein